MFVDLGGMPLEEAYRLGDLNGDSWNNEFDFELFKGAFDAAHGAGAFDNMLARVPEPATWRLAVLGAALALCLVSSPRSRPWLPTSLCSGGECERGNRSRGGTCPPPRNVAAKELALTDPLQSATLWGGVGGGETRQIALSFPPIGERLREREADQLTEEV